MLGGVIKYQLETTEGEESVKESLKEDTYVDNVMGLLSTEGEAKEFKGEATEIMSKGQFPLGKWEFNIDALNDDKDRVEIKLLGVGWNKKEGTFAVELEVKETPTFSKRAMLQMIASFYDPLGLMSPILVEGKHLYISDSS